MRFPVSVNARIFGHQPNTCRPAADEAPRRTPENTFGTQGTGYRTPLTFFFFTLPQVDYVVMYGRSVNFGFVAKNQLRLRFTVSLLKT